MAEQYKAPTKMQEQALSNLRREKDYVAEQYSNEKGNRMRLQDEMHEMDYQIAMQNKELRELRAQNERLVDAERSSIRQIEELQSKIIGLTHDNENQFRQIKAQEDAIIQA